MSDNSNKAPLDDLMESMREYLDMRVDEAKLKLSGELTRISSRIVSFFCIALLAVLVIAFLAMITYTWIGELLGNPLYGMLVTAGMLIIGIIVIFAMRNTLFSNSLLRMYIKIFFGNNDEK